MVQAKSEQRQGIPSRYRKWCLATCLAEDNCTHFKLFNWGPKSKIEVKHAGHRDDVSAREQLNIYGGSMGAEAVQGRLYQRD